MAAGYDAPFSRDGVTEAPSPDGAAIIYNNQEVPRAVVQSFLDEADGHLIGEAIGSAYANVNVRENAVFMGWLTMAGSKFWAHMEAAGIAKLDDEKKVVVL